MSRDDDLTAGDNTRPRPAPQAPTCPDCGSTLDRTGQEVNCPDCGRILDTPTLDRGPVWETDTETDTDRHRTGPAITERFHDQGLGSEIGADTQLGSPPRRARQLRRLRNRHAEGKFASRTERSRASGLGEVHRLCTAVAVSESLTDRARNIFRTAHEADAAAGFSIDELAAASVIAAIRDREQPIPMATVLEHTDAPHRRVYVLLQAVYTATDATPTPVDPIEHLPRLCSTLQIPAAVERSAANITAAAQSTGLHSGTNPESIPAAAIYIAADVRDVDLTQTQVANATSVSRRTIQNHVTTLHSEGIVETALTA